MTFGCTIAEAQERLSLREFNRWAKYRKERGSLNVGLRVERSLAVLSSMYANRITKEGGFKPEDFMPHAGERVLTLAEAMKAWA
ncbi:phage tail assembly protein T [Pseudomonas rhizophila]|uniref:phage tail assembly protein T n=1 Tax=Pseudomonas rhizophila TaxID=2045200 RepID=UPI003BB5484E